VPYFAVQDGSFTLAIRHIAIDNLSSVKEKRALLSLSLERLTDLHHARLQSLIHLILAATNTTKSRRQPRLDVSVPRTRLPNLSHGGDFVCPSRTGHHHRQSSVEGRRTFLSHLHAVHHSQVSDIVLCSIASLCRCWSCTKGTGATPTRSCAHYWRHPQLDTKRVAEVAPRHHLPFHI